MRSSQPDVRNPLLALPAAKRIRGLSPEVRMILADLIKQLGQDARERAQESWRKNKGPMAVYWKATGAYCTHIYRVCRPSKMEPQMADQKTDSVVAAVRADLLSRSELGIAKYGVTLDRTDLNLRDWLQHAYEETLDQANYLKRAIMEIDANG